VPVLNGAVSNGTAVTAGFHADFRRCYRKGLRTDPGMKGQIDIGATLGPTGQVASVRVTTSRGLSGEVIACVTARVAAAQYAPPVGGTATVSIPVTFMPNP
jgi:hypothetical protein